MASTCGQPPSDDRALSALEKPAFVSEAFPTLQTQASLDQNAPRLLGIFARWRLLAYGYTFPVFYGAFFLYLYRRGLWLVNESGAPVYHDFTRFWVAGWQALHGETALHSLAAFKAVQDSSAGLGHSPYSLLSYPPTFTLILVPLALLPYFAAFLTWEAVTLVCCIAVVYLIVRRQPAVSLMLASPFAAWNFLIGQNGFLTASLLGASLLFLERRPVLAGTFIGCLTYKPQFGVLFPVALIAARRWRACVSATVTAIFLGVASVAAFGVDGWTALPRALFAEGSETMLASPDWGFMLQTVYGLILVLHGGPALAWLAQSVATAGAGVVVWLVWRSPVRYALKAATLSAGALIASPYAFAYDLAAIAIPVAFLASDQIERGLLRGEQTTLIALFVVSLAVIPAAGEAPVGAVILVALLCLILRRALRRREKQAILT
jgi:arabinofuranan 3-O-arabinosyltransferase